MCRGFFATFREVLLPSCHPERRKAYTPPAVEPVGRCVASGSTRRKDDIPSCHPERSPPEIPPSLCSVLLRSSTPLRFAQNDTGGRSRNPKGERQRRSDLAGRLKPALWKTPLARLFFLARVDKKDATLKMLKIMHVKIHVAF